MLSRCYAAYDPLRTLRQDEHLLRRCPFVRRTERKQTQVCLRIRPHFATPVSRVPSHITVPEIGRRAGL